MKCPYCGSCDVISHWNEEDYQGFEGKEEAECEHCHAKFHLEIKITPKPSKRNLKLDITKAKP